MMKNIIIALPNDLLCMVEADHFWIRDDGGLAVYGADDMAAAFAPGEWKRVTCEVEGSGEPLLHAAGKAA